MGRIDSNDIVTYYIVEVNEDSLGTNIQAWSDDKELVKAYMEFHKCKRFKVKKVTNKMSVIGKYLIENAMHDELGICWISVRNPKPKPGEELIQVAIPMTQSEMAVINDEINSKFSSYGMYQSTHQMIGFLKNKYQRALAGIMYTEFMKQARMETPKDNPIINAIQYDELKILFSQFPDHFGK